MNNTNMHKNRKISRVIVIAVIVLASFFGKSVLRDIPVMRGLSRQPVTEDNLSAQIAEYTGRQDISVYSIRNVDGINGTPDFIMACYLVGDEDSYTDMGYAFFDKREINKKVGFLNVVSGYDTVLDKVETAMLARDAENNFTVCSFNTLVYGNWTFNVPMFILAHNDDISKAELVLNSGDIITYREDYHKGVFEIEPEHRYSLESVNMYDTEGNAVAQYTK